MEDTEDKVEDMPTVLSYCADPCLWAFIKSYFKNIISQQNCSRVRQGRELFIAF